MPVANTVKHYVSDGVYHIYNRGVNKRLIFIEPVDYEVFIYLTKKYLSKFSVSRSDQGLHLLVYCLMPNHFHFLIRQHSEPRQISKFMQGLITSYVMYFNDRYQRTGTLFESRYKGILVKKDMHLLQLVRYIHLNPLRLSCNPFEYDYSSIKNYLGEQQSDWIHTNLIADYFKSEQKSGRLLSKNLNNFLKHQ